MTKTITVDCNLTLAECQDFVGGNIELVYLNDKEVMVIDEEGKMKSKPINPHATIHATRNRAIFNNDWIAGDAIIMLREHWELEE